MAASYGLHAMTKFDPEDHQGNVYEAFCDFIDSFHYEYDAIAKEPPKEGSNTEKAAWVEQDKRKIFLGRFASRNLQRDFEEVVPEKDRGKITFMEMTAALKGRYDISRNTTLANFEFHKLFQKESESFDSFTVRVKHEAKTCEFSCTSETCTVKNILTRDQIIIGTSNNEIRKNALKNQWDLDNLIKGGRQLEAAARGAQRIHENSEAPVSRIKRPGKYSRKGSKSKYEGKLREKYSNCPNCSSRVCKGGKQCPAANRECFDCGKTGHFKGSAICKKKREKIKPRTRRVESSSSKDESSDTETCTSESDSSSSQNINRVRFMKNVTKIRRMRIRQQMRKTSEKSRYQVEVIIKERRVSAFADTGADICVMSRKKAEALALPLGKTKMKIRPYGSKSVKCCGYYIGTIMHGESVANTCIYVVKQDLETLLSGRVSEELGIITFNPTPDNQQPSIRRNTEIRDDVKASIISQYPEVFTGIGTLKDHFVKFHINENIPPVAAPARPVPFHLRKRFEKEIQTMEENNIIEEHIGPAPWISNVVLAPKDDGSIRVTVDMRQANRAIESTNIPIPRVEDIKTQLARCQHFSKLDFKSAFHQLELDEESKKITVFHAGDRLMRYRKLTMGTKPASGELTKALLPLFQPIQEAHVIHDDLIIAAKTKKQHDHALNRVLQVIAKSGMTLNPDKCMFDKEEIPFWGLRVCKDGIKPDPEKVKALQHASRPRSKDELQSFLCMIQSNKDFIPDLASKTMNLRMRTKKHSRFTWDKECQREFDRLKVAFREDTLLRHFNPEEDTFIFVDAHLSGLSAILMQGETSDSAKPVAFASRATTPVEQRYPQLDLEALAIDFGLRRFRYFIAGGPEIKVVTDHKPLVSIFSNARKGSVRTDRIKLRHQDMKYKVIWKEGKVNPADYLSRHATPFSSISRDQQKETSELEKTVWLLQYAPYTESISMSRIIDETDKDKTLHALKKYIRKGYVPKTKANLAPFKKIFAELTISDEELIMKGERIILPESLWDIALVKAHQGGHPGMNSLKRRLRSHFWFPKMNQKVEEKVASCKECQLFTNKTMHEPIQSHRTPEHAWQDVSIDLFGPMPDSKHVLVVLDKMSRFPAAKLVPNTAAKPVIKALDDIYTDFGYPEMHRTDNGPPFDSKAFAEFSQGSGIDHVKTFPYHPQANPAETFMRPLGKALKAAHFNKKDKHTAIKEVLATYRATPHPATGVPPGDLLLRSGYRKDFPRRQLTEQQIREAQMQDRAQRMSREDQMNRSTHRKKSIYTPGDLVYIRNMQRCKFDSIFGPELYKVLCTEGSGLLLESLADNKSFRRHCDDVKPAVSQGKIEDHTIWIENQAHQTENANNQDPVPDMTEEPVIAPAGVTAQHPNEDRATRPRRETRLPARFKDYVRY